MARSIPLLILYIAGFIGLHGCAAQVVDEPAASGADLAILWVRNAAEYRALSLQAYGAATRDLPRFLEDSDFSAIPYQTDARDLPPAIIFDVDETLVTNVEFQLQLEPPFRNSKLHEWNAANVATPVPGAPEFVQLARDSGVQLFFVTNRPCEPIPGDERPCPQKHVTIDDLNEAGIPAEAANVMLVGERPDWTQEKKGRRDLIARDYRVIMLIGDDLGDFIPCVRARPSAPCTRGATRESRQRETSDHAGYWGNGWYVLPNPMHGSWTSAP